MTDIDRFRKGGEVSRTKEIAGRRVAKGWESIDALLALYARVEKEHKTPWLMFDIDGVLIRAGLETPAADQTVESYASEHGDAVVHFKRRIHSLRAQGFRVAINTGRGAEFARKVVGALFPEDSVDVMVCESGGVIVSPDAEGNLEITRRLENVSEEGVKALKDSEVRRAIVARAEELGGGQEHGSKEVMLSLNPPQGMSIEEFFKLIRSFVLERVGAEHIDITHSKTAVDIAPKGIDKLAALKEVAGDGLVTYFGDAPGDEKAMGGAVVAVAPNNAFDSTKQVARNAPFGLLSEADELKGTADALREIELFYRFATQHEGGKPFGKAYGGAREMHRSPLDALFSPTPAYDPEKEEEKWRSRLSSSEALVKERMESSEGDPAENKVFVLGKVSQTERPDGTKVWEVDIADAPIVALNDKVKQELNLPETTPTVKEMRGKSLEDGFTLISGGAFLRLDTAKESAWVITKRSDDAEVDPGMRTGPAGRCDTSLSDTVLGELNQELIIVKSKTGERETNSVVAFYRIEEQKEGIVSAKLSQAKRVAEKLREQGKGVNAAVLEALTPDSFVFRKLDELVGAGTDTVILKSGSTVIDAMENASVFLDERNNTLEVRQILTTSFGEDEELVSVVDGEIFGDGTVAGREVELVLDGELNGLADKPLAPALKNFIEQRSV